MATLVSRISDLATAIRDKINLMVPRLLLAGGASSTVLSKSSATDYATAWSTIAALMALSPQNSPWNILDCFYNANVQMPPWNGAAISSGTITTAPNPTIYDTQPVAGVFLFRSSATANSGYSIRTGAAEILIKGGEVSFHIIATRPGSVAGTTRFGFLDTNSSSAPVDGLVFELNNVTLTCANYNNGSVSTAALTTLTDSVFVFCRITVNANATSVKYEVFALNGTPIVDATLTTNIPTGSGRLTGHGIVATNSGASANDICLLDKMGFALTNRALGV